MGRLANPRLLSPVASRCRRPAAFTLVELLIVLAIIAILAALTVGILGAANRGSAESRAKGEVAAIVGALEDFRLAYGGLLPASTTYGTNTTMNARELVGDTADATDAINISGRVFLEPSRANYTNGVLLDPWGNAYVYETNSSGYEVYSTGDGRSTNSFIHP